MGQYLANRQAFSSIYEQVGAIYEQVVVFSPFPSQKEDLKRAFRVSSPLIQALYTNYYPMLFTGIQISL